ncbi:MAG: dGTP triphosphohydrolase [Desulfovibrio sp.]
MTWTDPNRFYNDFDMECVTGGQPRALKGRTVFEQDRDRLIYAAPFRALQAKTQVFTAGEYDFYRTRLTHSMEVAQVGRSISKHLNRTSFHLDSGCFCIDTDLVESICLSHDIGHPPFGHAGESALNAAMKEYGGFEGNAQNLRVLMYNFYGSGSHLLGMNPSRAFLDGLLKYKQLFSDSVKKKNHFLYDEQNELLEFVFGGKNIQEYICLDELNSFKALECQIMDWADDVAYSVGDIGDGIEAGFITVESLEKYLSNKQSEFTVDDAKEIKRLQKSIIDKDWGRLLGACIGHFIAGTDLGKRKNFMSDKSNRYAYQLTVTEEARKLSSLYKNIALRVVFETPHITQLEYKGGRMLTKLFAVLKDEYIEGEGARAILPEPFHATITALTGDGNQVQKARLVADFLTHLTDASLVRTYRRLFDPAFGSFADIL